MHLADSEKNTLKNEKHYDKVYGEINIQSILDKISAKVHAKEVKSKVAINLVKCFKKQEKVFLKLIRKKNNKI